MLVTKNKNILYFLPVEICIHLSLNRESVPASSLNSLMLYLENEATRPTDGPGLRMRDVRTDGQTNGPTDMPIIRVNHH